MTTQPRRRIKPGITSYEFLTSRLLLIRDRAHDAASQPQTDENDGRAWEVEFLARQRDSAIKLLRGSRPTWDAVAVVDALTVLSRLAGISFGEGFGYMARQIQAGAKTEHEAMSYLLAADGFADKVREHDPRKVRWFDSLLESFLKVD